jgi:hypothetical protein
MNRPGGDCGRRSPDPGGASRFAGLIPGARGLVRGTAADPREATIHKLNVIKHAASSEDARIQHFGKPSRRSKRCALPVFRRGDELGLCS